MPLRAFIDSDGVNQPRCVANRGVLMPLRAFIDSDFEFERSSKWGKSRCLNALTGIYWFGLWSWGTWCLKSGFVLMPLRAFIDSDRMAGRTGTGIFVRLNALTGIYWFGPKSPLVLSDRTRGLNALTGIYWFGPRRITQQSVGKNPTLVLMPLRAFIDSDKAVVNAVIPPVERLNALTGIYWFGQSNVRSSRNSFLS